MVDERLNLHMERETFIIPQNQWLSGLELGDRVNGPALKRLASQLPEGTVAVPEKFWQPTASAVGEIAWKDFQAGRRDDVWKLSPNYYRPSAAEEKRMT